MTATAHALVGALIAGRIGDPALAIPISFFSHFAGDVLPHWDSGTNRRRKTRQQVLAEAMVDVVVGFVVSVVLFTAVTRNGNFVLLYACIFAAQAPDWLSAPFVFFRYKLQPFMFITQIQEKLHSRLDKPWGIVTQIVALVALYILLYVIF